MIALQKTSDNYDNNCSTPYLIPRKKRLKITVELQDFNEEWEDWLLDNISTKVGPSISLHIDAPMNLLRMGDSD